MWVRHRVCKHLFACWFYLTSSVLFFRRFMAPTITPTSHPIHHPVVLKSHCEKMRRQQGKKWFAILLANACKLTCFSAAPIDATIHNTQQPNPTQQSIFRSVTKGSAKKKGKQWTAENCLLPYIFVHSPSLCCF